MALKQILNKSRRIYRIPKAAAWFYPRRFWYGNKEKIYLTFDDGPHPEITPWLLEELEKEKIKSTFFWLGENIEKHPEFIALTEAKGHRVGHHGYKHISSFKMSQSEFEENYNASEKLVNTKLFRPPYGDIKSSHAKYVNNNGKIVMWSWMTYDFDETVPVEEITEKIHQNLSGGDVVVLHENDKSKDRIEPILKAIIKVAREKGLSFDLIPM